MTKDIYFAICLKTTANNVANGFGGQLIKQDYADVLFPKDNMESRTEAEIKDDIKTKLENMR